MSLPVVVVRATPGINCTASFCKLFLTTVAGIAVLSESFLSESNESVIFLETADTVAESFLTEAVPGESLTTEAFPPESFFNASCCAELFATGVFFCESGHSAEHRGDPHGHCGAALRGGFSHQAHGQHLCHGQNRRCNDL